MGKGAGQLTLYIKSTKEKLQKQVGLCLNIDAQPPINQSTVNGVKVCAKPASGMSLAKGVRPTKSGAAGVYDCPSGYKPCQESWLNDEESLEFALCIPSDQDASTVCPITSFAFTLEGMT